MGKSGWFNHLFSARTFFFSGLSRLDCFLLSNSFSGDAHTLSLLSYRPDDAMGGARAEIT